MPAQLFFLIIIIGVILFVCTLELIRRSRLREEFSLIWLFSAAILIVLPFFKSSFHSLANLLGIEYPPSLIFLVSIILLSVMLINHSMTLSSLSSHNRDLAQKLGILELELANLHAQISLQENKVNQIVPLKALLDVSAELRKFMHLPDLLQHTLEVATQCVGGNSGSLVILDENGRLIRYLVAYKGETNIRDPRELADTVERGLAGWVISTRNPALVVSTQDDPRWIKRPWDEKPGASRSAVSVPLEAENHVAGVLTVTNPQRGYFNETDMIFLLNVAAIIAQVGSDILVRPSEWIEYRPRIDRSVASSKADEATLDRR